MLGKAIPYPAKRGLVLCPGTRRQEPRYGASGPTRRRSACSYGVQGMRTPLPRSPLHAISGATLAGSRSSGLRQQGRAGQLQGVKS